MGQILLQDMLVERAQLDQNFPQGLFLLFLKGQGAGQFKR